MSKPRYYLDHAATTPLLPEVRNYLMEITGKYYGNPSSTHAEGRASRSFIEESRKTIAKNVGANPSEIFFTASGSESNNLILKGAVGSLGVQRIISTRIEHSCNLQCFEWLQKNKLAEIVFLDVDAHGRIQLDQLESLLKNSNGKTLVSLMHVNNEIGTQIDLSAISQLCKQYDALFHSDTVQGLGFNKYDLNEVSIDFLSGSAHKFYAPKGCAFVYINGRHILQPLIHGGSQERNMRAGTENIYGIGCMSFALNYCNEHLESRLVQLAHLKQRFVNGIMNVVPGAQLNSPPDHCSPKIANVQFPWFEGNELMNILFDIEGLSVSAGSACSSGTEKGSHVISTIRPDHKGKAVRFSFAHFNTDEEIDSALEIIAKCLRGKL
ncbi:MAG: cysteine desulfurase [Saprospiraceae bacterium]|nr:cysteine desulfurase [Saprospiraceae bacterium]